MLYVVSPFETENFSKKISSRNLEIAIASGMKAKVISSSFDHRYKKYNEISKVKSFLSSINENIGFVHIPTTPYKRNVSIARVFSNLVFSFLTFIYLIYNAKKNDYVLINSIPPELCFFTTIASKIKKFKIIMDVRDIWPDALVVDKSVTSNLFRVYCNFFYKNLVKSRISKVFFVAHSFKDWIFRHQIEAPALFLPLGYDASRWNHDISIVSVFTKKLVYIGYLSQQFDLSIYIDFVNKNTDWKLFVIGGGQRSEEYKKLDVNDAVSFYGMVPPTSIPGILSDISPDIAILPLTSGAKSLMPNKLFDYIANELPIIVTGSDDAGKFVEKNSIGWYIENVNDLEREILVIEDSQVSFMRDNLIKIKSNFSMQKLYANKELWK